MNNIACAYTSNVTNWIPTYVTVQIYASPLPVRILIFCAERTARLLQIEALPPPKGGVRAVGGEATLAVRVRAKDLYSPPSCNKFVRLTDDNKICGIEQSGSSRGS